MESKAVASRWFSLCEEISLDEEAASFWWNLIETHYTEPQRYYHTLTHISELLAYVEQ